MIWKEEIEEVRKILWEKYDAIIPDQSVELMIYTFKQMAKIFIRNLKKESE